MNIIEAVRVFRSNEAPASKVKKYNDAVQSMDAIVAQYDALAPTPEMWEQYPWAQWCAIHNIGWRYFYDEFEPFVEIGNSTWRTKGKRCDFYEDIDLTLGLDWRLCKWQRPEGAAG